MREKNLRQRPVNYVRRGFMVLENTLRIDASTPIGTELEPIRKRALIHFGGVLTPITGIQNMRFLLAYPRPYRLEK
jgi:hypothetical protein